MHVRVPSPWLPSFCQLSNAQCPQEVSRSRNGEVSFPKRSTFTRFCFLSRQRQVMSLCFETFLHKDQTHIRPQRQTYVYIAQRIADASSKLRFYPLLYASFFFFFFCLSAHTHALSLSLSVFLSFSFSYLCFTCKCKKSPVGIVAFEHASFHSPARYFGQVSPLCFKTFFALSVVFLQACTNAARRQSRIQWLRRPWGISTILVVRPRNPLENIPKRAYANTTDCVQRVNGNFKCSRRLKRTPLVAASSTTVHKCIAAPRAVFLHTRGLRVCVCVNGGNREQSFHPVHQVTKRYRISSGTCAITVRGTTLSEFSSANDKVVSAVEPVSVAKYYCQLVNGSSITSNWWLVYFNGDSAV